MDSASLQQKLTQIDGRGYKAYGQIRGVYRFPHFSLFIDYVQGDPFATPSRMRARVPQADAGFDAALFENRVRRVALEDFIARAFSAAIGRIVQGNRGTGKSGYMGVDRGGQEILERTAALVTERFVEVRFVAGLPADGRRCLGREAVAMLLDELPRLVDASLFHESLEPGAVHGHIAAAEDQEWLRGQLQEKHLVAFVADGSILPRESGIRDLPLTAGNVVSFQTPPELRLELQLPNRGRVSGMGIPEGVSLIVGGGYHGKSTLLSALERGVYSHIPGDGRELVASRADAVKIRAEDGRRVEKVDISPFINNLPFGTGTVAFCTVNASGSTSQAANIAEALEVGSRLLLVDEDTSATNFMIRDEMMQQLIAREKEPITPFIDQVKNLYREHGVSTVLVMGGSGEYLEVADTVIAMENYEPRVVTRQARKIVAARKSHRNRYNGSGFGPLRPRVPLAQGINPRRGRKDKVATRGLRTILFGRESADLGCVEQLVDRSQTRAIGHLVWCGLRQGYFDGESTLSEVLDRLLADVMVSGLDIISPHRRGNEEMECADMADVDTAGNPHPGDYALPRRYELAAMLNRLRSFTVR